MIVKIEVPDYSPRGLRFVWEEGYAISTRMDGDTFVLSANEAGLISLARHLLLLAQISCPIGSHFH